MATLTLVSTLVLGGCGRAAAGPLPAAFAEVDDPAGGGSVWMGAIPGSTNESAVYLPPAFSRSRRYPVVYLLHGMPGSPLEYVNSLGLGSLADTLIARGDTRPFIAVAPVAGRKGTYDGEWAGPWEDYVVRRVVPWVDAHLPTIRSARGRTLAGLSAGGYGAIDIGLRHPLLFGRLESWDGYFSPFGDPPLDRDDADALAAHDPRLLARGRAGLLRRRAVRFFLSTGPSHGKVKRSDTIRFAQELRGLRVPYRLEVVSTGRLWERQLAAGLRWALAPANASRRSR